MSTYLSKIDLSAKTGERDVPEAEGIYRFPAPRVPIDDLKLS
jgi:hypothetical protein